MIRWILLAWKSTALLPLLACAALAQARETVTLQLKWKHQFQFAGYYAAESQGYYRQAGLDVKFLEAPPEAQPAQAVLRGQADFGIASSDLILLRSRGYPVVALAAVFQHSPLILIAARRAGIDSVHDLAGKRVMIEPHADELLAYLETESVPASKMTMVPHTFDAQPLIDGRVDAMSAYSTDEPFFVREAGLDHLILNPRSGGIDFYGDTLFTTEEQIRRNPARVKAFIEASLRGWQYALDHPAELIDLIATRYSTRHSRAHLEFEAEQTRRLILSDVVELGYMNPGRWRHIADTYAMRGMIPRDISLDGFLYERNPRPPIAWFYYALAGALAVLGAVSFAAVRYYRLNRAIRREIAERERAEAGLRALERRYRILVENAPFPIVITEIAGGAVRYVNPKGAEMFRVSRDGAVGQPSRSFYENPDDRDAMVATLQRQGLLVNHEILVRAADGHAFWTSLSANIVEFEDRSCLFCTFSDISDRKALEERLVGASRSKTAFLTNMSHEIRSPLTGILGVGDLLWNSTLTPEQRGWVTILRRAGDSLLTVINDILDISKVEAGHLRIQRVEFALSGVLDDVNGIMLQRARDRGVALVQDVAADVPRRLTGDPDRLRQVLLNLVGNAVKFTAEGHIRVTVRVVENTTLRFAVADTGPGIPPEKQALIFDAFQQGGAGVKGTGLGLTISRQLVELMGGVIALESEVGRGSTFWFTVAFQAAGAAPRVPLSIPAAPEPRLPAHILLADDSRESAMIVAAFLKDTGYRIDTASNGAEAVDRVCSGNFDLILMDVEMPVMDGNAAARAIREWEKATGRAAIPILALTAHAVQTEVEKILLAGCTAHLAKPIARAELLRAIDTLLAARSATSA